MRAYMRRCCIADKGPNKRSCCVDTTHAVTPASLTPTTCTTAYLWAHSHHALESLHVLVHIHTKHLHRAGGGLEQPSDDVQRGGLPSAIVPKQCQNLRTHMVKRSSCNPRLSVREPCTSPSLTVKLKLSTARTSWPRHDHQPLRYTFTSPEMRAATPSGAGEMAATRASSATPSSSSEGTNQASKPLLHEHHILRAVCQQRVRTSSRIHLGRGAATTPGPAVGEQEEQRMLRRPVVSRQHRIEVHSQGCSTTRHHTRPNTPLLYNGGTYSKTGPR